MFERLRRARARTRTAKGSTRHLAEAVLNDTVDALAPRLPLATVRDDLVACPECDALHRRSSVEGVGRIDSDSGVMPSGSHYECRRCGATLGRARHASFDLPLALASSGLVMLAVAHLNPILSIDIQGQPRSTTLWEAAWTLYGEGSWLVAVLVLFTTLLNPMIEMAAVCYVLLPLRSGQRAAGSDLVLRSMQAVQPWVMVEVFMLGVLVAFVKLNGLASVIPGAGLWAFAAVMVLAAAMASAFDQEHVWAAMAALRVKDPPPMARR